MGSLSSNKYVTRASSASMTMGRVSSVICMIRLSPPVAIHRLLCFPAGILVTFVLAAVPRLFALGQRDFDLGNAVAEINAQGNDGQTFRFGTARQFVDFTFMKQQLAVTKRFMIPGPAGHILGNVRVGEVSAAGLEVHVSVANVGLAFAEGFDFRAVQHQSRFQLLKDMIVVGSGAVLGDDQVAGASGIFALLGFLSWLGHNLSFYPMLRLNKQGRLAKVAQPVEKGPSHVCAGPLDGMRVAHGTV